MFYMRNIEDIDEFPPKKETYLMFRLAQKKCFKRLIVCYFKDTSNLERPNYV